MNSKEFQQALEAKLKSKFANNIPIITEWSAFKSFGIIYSPRIDIAIGPFAINDRKEREYDDLFRSSGGFVGELFQVHINNMAQYSDESYSPLEEINTFNRNARCFMAIEIEKSGSRKHMLGDIVNASALGRIGIIIAWDEFVMKAFFRQLKYFSFLQSVGKKHLQLKTL